MCGTHTTVQLRLCKKSQTNSLDRDDLKLRQVTFLDRWQLFQNGCCIKASPGQDCKPGTKPDRRPVREDKKMQASSNVALVYLCCCMTAGAHPPWFLSRLQGRNMKTAKIRTVFSTPKQPRLLPESSLSDMSCRLPWQATTVRVHLASLYPEAVPNLRRQGLHERLL